MDDIEKKLLYKTLLKCWGADTAKGEWREDCPEFNQCAVTSLIVQDYFGGDLIRCPLTGNDKEGHYYNQLPSGEYVDLTQRQFLYRSDLPDKTRQIVRDRNYVLSFPDTKQRYEILSKRLEDLLGWKK